MIDGTKKWLIGLAIAVAIVLPIAALIALLVFDSVLLLRIYAALAFIALLAGLFRGDLATTQKSKTSR